MLWGLRVLAKRAGAGLGGLPCRPATGTYLQWSRCDGIVRVASRKVRALWALSQREMTSGAPTAGAGEREDFTSPNGLIGGQWLGTGSTLSNYLASASGRLSSSLLARASDELTLR